MAAPMVLGVAMDLMDAGVWDELEIKALLINTAQKNEAGVNFESDSDGWSTAYGWGYMNAWSAYYHRSDVRSESVTPSGTSGDYDLWKGQMRDESTGEGRDRVTLVWNRHAAYADHTYPSTTYALNDLDLFLYNEGTGAFIDGDSTVLDNVHQVRVGSGAGLTSVVAKVAAYSSSFNGVSAEEYALATEEGFTLADPPTFSVSFDPIGTVATGAAFAISVDIANSGDVASFNNSVNLTVPVGFTIVSGADPQNIGTIAAGGTGTANWTVQAPAAQGTYSLSASVGSSSYGEYYSKSGSRSVNVASLPSAPSTIVASDGTYADRVAVSWSSSSGATTYQLFRCTTSSTSSCGSTIYTGSSLSYNDTGASPGVYYYYRVKACNTAGCSGYSSYNTGYRLAPPATPSTPSASDGSYTDRVRVSWSSVSGATSYQVFRCTSSSTSSCGAGFTDSASPYDDYAAAPGVTYFYRVKACNTAGCSGYSSYNTGYRLAPPATPSTPSASDGSYTDRVRVSWSSVSGATSYQVFRCTSSSTSSCGAGFTDSASPYDDYAAAPGVTYYYRVKACNAAGCSSYSTYNTGYRGATSGTTEDLVGFWRLSTKRFYLDANGSGSWNGTSGGDVVTAPWNWVTASEIPVTGDWDGDGDDEVGFWRPSTKRFYLDANGSGSWNGTSGGDVVTSPWTWVTAAEIPVTGDWDGDGDDDVGFWRPSTKRFYLDANGNGSWNGPSGGDVVTSPWNWVTASEIPITGDWDGDGDGDVGFWRPSAKRFYLDANGNGSWNGPSGGDVVSAPWNWVTASETPITGDWDADGDGDVGFWRPSAKRFYLDANGNGSWNGPSGGDVVTAAWNWVTASEIPVAGRW